MTQSSTTWWIQVFDYLAPHWWGIAAIAVAPLTGYAAARRFRAHARREPGNLALAAVSGTVTFVLSLLMWWKGYRDIEGAVLIAVIMGIGYPVAFTAIMGAFHRWWPWGYERLSGRPAAGAERPATGADPAQSGNTFFPRW